MGRRTRAERETTAVDGVLVVDKPAGPTSHDVVARVRRLIGTSRVGHTGTLDPFATGVLPLVLGRATRLARFLAVGPKAYCATVRLGVATDTHDAQGRPVRDQTVSGPVPDLEVIAHTLARFRGPIVQAPPVFSAKKVGGTRAYSLARRKQPVSLEPVTVETFHLAIEDLDGPYLRLSIVCSGGFYVRALARDLGEALHCGAHLTQLRRTASGEFSERDAVDLEGLEQAVDHQVPRLKPLSSLLSRLPAAHLRPEAAARVAHGTAITDAGVVTWHPPAPPDTTSGPAAAWWREDPSESLVRLTDPEGRLLAIGSQAHPSPSVAMVTQLDRPLAMPPTGKVLQPLVVLV